MKKFLLSGSITALFLPVFAFAAFSDVLLTATLSIGGSSYTVSGATLSQITVGESSFVVILMPGSSIDIVSADKKSFTVSGNLAGSVTTDSCGASQSEIRFDSSAAISETITITPSGTCSGANAIVAAAPLADSSSSNNSSSGGNGPVISSGGGGGGSFVPAAPPAPAKSNLSSSAQLLAQLNALQAQIAALKGGGASPSANAYANAGVNASFKRDMQLGSTGSDAKALQMYLNTHGFPVTSTGAGSLGNETTRFGTATKAALAKWQKSVGISPASGNFGPKTRAYIKAHQ